MLVQGSPPPGQREKRGLHYQDGRRWRRGRRGGGGRKETEDGRNMFVYDGGWGGRGDTLTRGFGLEDKKHRQPSKNIYYRLVGLK